MPELVPPHGGGELNALLLPAAERPAEIARARDLLHVPMSSREVSDVLMLAMGAYTPLEGFMGEADWRGVCEDMKLSSGLFWPIPITLSCLPDLAEQIEQGSEVALVDGESGEVLALMRVEEIYTRDRKFECERVYGTVDRDHPGVKNVLDQPEFNLAGPVACLSEGVYPSEYPDLYLRPDQSRKLFIEKGWSQVAAFQTRNPMHRSHEHLVKIAIEVTDGVFIHHVLGKLKPGDQPRQ
jgi:sulfate adenylyltransferase